LGGLVMASSAPARVRAAGIEDMVELSMGDGAVVSRRSRLALPVALGAFGSLLLMGFYVGVVTLAQGFDHAAELMLQDWYFVLPIVLGFGTQVGLFTYLRRATHRHSSRSATAAAGVGTGTSSVSMVACCAHHLAELLPIIGLSGAAIFLNDYRQPLMALGIVTNLAGIAIMVRAIRRARRMERAV